MVLYRIVLIGLLVVLLVSGIVVVSEERLPPWVERVTMPTRTLYNVSEKELMGVGFTTEFYYKPESVFVEINDEGGVLVPTLKIRSKLVPVKGILFYYDYVPYLYTKITVIEEKSMFNSYEVTPVALTHVDYGLKEMLILRIYVDKNYNNILRKYVMNFEIEWLHTKFFDENGSFSIIRKDYLYANFEYNDTGDYLNAWSLIVLLNPAFFYTTEGNVSCLIFGFDYEFDLMVYGSASNVDHSTGFNVYSAYDPNYSGYNGVRGGGHFAWETYVIARNSTLKEFSEDLRKIMGWYAWVGVGVKYYIPWGSVLQDYTSFYDLYNVSISDEASILRSIVLGEDYVLITNDSFSFRKDYGSGAYYYVDPQRIVSLRGKFIIDDVKAKNYVVDVDRLYEFFTMGLLREYRNPVIYYERYHRGVVGQTLVYAGVYLSPILIMYFILGDLYGKHISLGIGLLIGGLIGLAIGLYGYADLVVVMLTFITYIVLKIYRGSGV